MNVVQNFVAAARSCSAAQVDLVEYINFSAPCGGIARTIGKFELLLWIESNTSISRHRVVASRTKAHCFGKFELLLQGIVAFVAGLRRHRVFKRMRHLVAYGHVFLNVQQTRY